MNLDSQVGSPTTPGERENRNVRSLVTGSLLSLVDNTLVYLDLNGLSSLK